MADGRKLILPTELRVCATCSYWDGTRSHDTEARLVVVEHQCSGECLLREEQICSTTPADRLKVCAWEPIEPAAHDESNLGDEDDVPEREPPAPEPGT